MSIFQYAKFVGREAIYLERGCVLLVRIEAVDPMEASADGAAFRLSIQKTFLLREPTLDQLLGETEDGYLTVSSVYLRVENAVVTASGYINWTIVLNPETVAEIILALNDEREAVADGSRRDACAYRICRTIIYGHIQRRRALDG